MPKVTWIRQQKPQEIYAQADHTLDLIKRYQKAQKITNKRLAQILGYKNEQAVKDKKYQGTNRWTKKTLLTWSIALNIPTSELSKALLLDSNQ